jgi:predicted metal-binding membrane protein
MNSLAIILAAVTAIFALAWAYVIWLKVHEHHRELNDEHQHHHKTHITFIRPVRQRSKRQ